MGELIHAVGHGLFESDTIMLGNLEGGAGLEENTLYYVLLDGLTADDFKVSETDGGSPLVYTTDITDGVIVYNGTYSVVSDGVMDPPTAVPTATAPTVSSTTIGGVVRLTVSLNDSPEAKVRVWEVQATHQFLSGLPFGGPCTGVAATDVVTITGHGMIVNDRFQFTALTGGTGIELEATYYVLTVPSADTFTFSATEGGATFDFTTDITDGTAFTVFDPIPDWDKAQVFNLPQGTTELSIPALGDTVYDVRVRAIDVYGNEGAFSDEVESTTVAGSDALAAALADLANDVSDGVITETKIADNAISTPKLQAGSVTAEVLAATIVLASLIQTAAEGSRVELDTDGIRLINSDEELIVRIPTNGDPVYIKGEVNADSLISQTAAEFRTSATLASNSIMTLENGISAPTVVPSLSAGYGYMSFTSTPPNLGYGICYDAAGDAGGATATYWVGADPDASDYVAHEFDATTGVLLRSITKTGSFTTYTTTLGSTSHVSDTVQAESGSSDDQVATPLTMTRDGRITKVSCYLAGYSGSATVQNAVWNSSNTLRRASSAYTAASASFGVGNSTKYNKSLTSPLTVNDGDTIRVGFLRTSGDFQWDRNDGGSYTTYIGDGGYGDLSGITTDGSHKPNVYITYEYDVDTVLEGYTGKIVGVARSASHIFVLEDTGVLYKYLQSDLSYVTKVDLAASISGSEDQAGLFYDATAVKLIVTTTTGTGAGVYPKVFEVDPTTLAVGTTYTAATGPTFTGTTAGMRGGARLNDPLNSNTATYWLCTSGGVVYAYTFSGSTLTNTANRNFGSVSWSATGVTHDGTYFRGYTSASPTRMMRFSNWDWTSASAVYWFGYAWYDSAGTTHETALGPRTSITMGRRQRLAITTAAIPTGGADDPDSVRIYTLPGASDFAAGAGWLQVTDALTSRFIETYTGSGTHDGAGTAFSAGTAAELKSAPDPLAGGWSIRGNGVWVPTSDDSFPASPTTGQHVYRTDIGMTFAYDGSRWQCTCAHTQTLKNVVGDSQTLSATTAKALQGPIPSAQTGSDIRISRIVTRFTIGAGTALSGSHKWVGTFGKNIADGTDTTISTITIDSGASSSWRLVETTVGADLGGSTFMRWWCTWTKTGTPGNISVMQEVTYRILAT